MTSSQTLPTAPSPLEALIEHCHRQSSRIKGSTGLWLTLNAASVAPEAATEWFTPSVFLVSPEESPHVGLGVAAEFFGSGAERFRAVRDAAGKLLEGLVSLDLSGGAAPAPRVYGGFAFRSGGRDAIWARFGDAHFVLPRFTYWQSPKGSSTLSICILQDEHQAPETLRSILRQALELRTRLERSTLEGPRSGTVPAVPSSNRGPSREHWGSQVSAIVAAIEAGRIDKVVAARRCVLEFDRTLGLASTLGALQGHNPTATRFSFRFGDSAFVGATPERLVRLSGKLIDTEALAGTFRRGESEFAAELLRSPKEHAEHAPVLQAIIETLKPLCSVLQYPPQPEIKELRRMLHLQTPITGQLESPVHVLRLVEALHPTPAVGGVPTPLAVDWITEHEPHERGWYSGPIGWFDAHGDGEFFVALRSGLLAGDTAYLFAGGGIVRASDPENEYLETELKLDSLRACLRTV